MSASFRTAAAAAMRRLDDATLALVGAGRSPDIERARRAVRLAQDILESASDRPMKTDSPNYKALYDEARRVAGRAGVSWAAVIGANRSRGVVNVRVAITKTLRAMGGHWKDIGAVMGRQHSAAIWYARRGERRTSNV